uniref:zincin-like metallopeptidase domain-containing protein n=1 Tax=Sphingobium sp. DC-2 TaxID=1303256 RepID=UPI00055ED0A2|nr:zincin-like metallopeptidase domain-containing protein [Sphingobium sp. DC-2]
MVFTFQPPFWAGLSGYVAEISAAFICAALGIAPTVRHADYVGSWLEVLREDNRAIFRAAGQASKAADYILGHGEAMTGDELGRQAA